MLRLLAYIGRFFHGLAYQPNVETVCGYVKCRRIFSRTDKGVNAVANPADVEDFIGDFVYVRGEAIGKPRRKEYRYFLPQYYLRLFEEFLSLVPQRIPAIAFTPRPRKKTQEIEVEILGDAIAFSSSGFEQYAIRRLLGYFYRRTRGVMKEEEILEAFRGNVRRYPPLAPAEALALRRTDVEVDDGNRRRIEQRISSRCRYRAKRKRIIKDSKRINKPI